MNNTYKLVEKEQQFLRDAQIIKQQYSYPLNLSVPNGNQREGAIVIDQDADFCITHITGKCIGPTDANGVQLPAQPTNFPMAGVLTGWAQSGLQLKIKDGSSSYELTDGFLNAETILTPNYGIQFTVPFKFEYFVRRNGKLVFTFINRDEATPTGDVTALFHSVYIAVHGFKYRGVTK